MNSFEISVALSLPKCRCRETSVWLVLMPQDKKGYCSKCDSNTSIS